jgi:UDP-N-acetylmuramoyl-L-alanyl-D-glutamate--2,6-diaminopimelate ligase
VAAAVALGADPTAAVAGAAAVPDVPGRFERVDAGQPFPAIVDFAHTPEALERVLELLRRVTKGRVIAVFGCGGERDAAKRGAMGRIAGRLADVVLVTDDNPRGEDPEAIAAAILAGLAGTPAAARRVAGRRAAIEQAVAIAQPDDAVLVAGKGHETTQETAGVFSPFDDREVLRAAIAAAGARR